MDEREDDPWLVECSSTGMGLERNQGSPDRGKVQGSQLVQGVFVGIQAPHFSESLSIVL